MNRLCRLLQLLTMTVWVGGLVFFAFVLAPTAFGKLPSQHEAGLIVGACLRVFDLVAMGAGAVFVIATALLFQRAAKRSRSRYRNELLLALAMLIATASIHYGILPAMERDRASAHGDIQSVPATEPAREDFDRLHAWSERIEGSVLFLGLGVIFLMSQEPGTPEAER